MVPAQDAQWSEGGLSLGLSPFLLGGLGEPQQEWLAVPAAFTPAWGRELGSSRAALQTGNPNNVVPRVVLPSASSLPKCMQWQG